MTLDEFVREAQRVRALHALRNYRAIFLEDSWSEGVLSWSLIDRPGIDRYFDRATHIAVVWPDGFAQLLSRDEAECRLFTTLWELER